MKIFHNSKDFPRCTNDNIDMFFCRSSSQSSWFSDFLFEMWKYQISFAFMSLMGKQIFKFSHFLKSKTRHFRLGNIWKIFTFSEKRKNSKVHWNFFCVSLPFVKSFWWFYFEFAFSSWTFDDESSQKSNSDNSKSQMKSSDRRGKCDDVISFHTHHHLVR